MVRQPGTKTEVAKVDVTQARLGGADNLHRAKKGCA
jgi:hypothetical protein